MDEIGNLSYEVQIQLLRALQERKIRPVGSNKEIQVDVRLVSATNENLEQAIEKGTFREDLYHRINEFTLRMPQLKDRREDILLFANFLWTRQTANWTSTSSALTKKHPKLYWNINGRATCAR